MLKTSNDNVKIQKFLHQIAVQPTFDLINTEWEIKSVIIETSILNRKKRNLY